MRPSMALPLSVFQRSESGSPTFAEATNAPRPRHRLVPAPGAGAAPKSDSRVANCPERSTGFECTRSKRTGNHVEHAVHEPKPNERKEYGPWNDLGSNSDHDAPARVSFSNALPLFVPGAPHGEKRCGTPFFLLSADTFLFSTGISGRNKRHKKEPIQSIFSITSISIVGNNIENYFGTKLAYVHAILLDNVP